MTPEGEELVVSERAAYVTYLLMTGKQLTTAEIAAELGMTHTGAWRLMQKVSRRVPVRCDLDFWFVVRTG